MAIPIPLTDSGNAHYLVTRHGSNLRYCHVWKKWLVWADTRWQLDAAGQIMALAKDSIGTLCLTGLNESQHDQQMIFKHAYASESDYKLNCMVRQAQSEPGIPIEPSGLDADQLLLNCLNCTLNFRLGTYAPHSRVHLITKMAPVEYNPDAPCPRWEEFLQRITARNKGLMSYLQRVVGYTLTGNTKEQALFILYGSGANGKTTFLETIGHILGDYASHTPTETLLVKHGDGIRNDIARLKGVRMVIAAEAEEGRRLATAQIKQLTGGDTVAARFLYGEHFEFTPEFKIFLSVNHRPVVADSTHSIWRRIHLIPFTVQIPEREKDPTLLEKLREQRSGILAWAVRGWLEYQKHGLGVPPEVQAATDQYKTEMDTLEAFLDDACDIQPTATVGVSELYDRYRNWCNRLQERGHTRQEFGTRLVEKTFEKRRSGANGCWEWHGLGLKGH